jgi:hypothetical protein
MGGGPQLSSAAAAGRRHRGIVRRRRLIVGLIVAGLIAAGVALAAGSGGRGLAPQGLAPLPAPEAATPPGSHDPFAYAASRQTDLIARATAGEAYVLYAKSPDGAVATAARVSKFQPLIQRAVAGTSVDPATLEAIVFLESAGDPNAVVGPDISSAAGLTQILADTGSSLLGMHIDLGASRALTKRILAAQGAGNQAAVTRLEAARARADDRFDPAKALAATVRYLEQAQARFGRGDLALESYHMGIGNLANVLSAYDGGTAVPYVQLYFDTAPDRNPTAYRLLSSFGDDSWTYYWRILAAEQIMRLYRSDRTQLERLASLETSAGSSAEALHPPDQTPTFADPASLSRGYAQGAVKPLPANPGALGLAYDPGMGAQAAKLGAPVALYRGLRQPALDLLLELATRVRALSHVGAPLTVTSTVSDQRYQGLAGANDPPAAAGWSFTLSRRYSSPRQAGALEATLDRLQALNLIAWQRYPAEIEVTVASDADQVIASGA